MHVVGPENGLTLPGLLLNCGDSHTSTHGAFGALAFGISRLSRQQDDHDDTDGVRQVGDEGVPDLLERVQEVPEKGAGQGLGEGKDAEDQRCVQVEGGQDQGGAADGS